MTNMDLSGKRVLITGGARRLGRVMSLSVAAAGGIPLIHYNQSPEEAEQTCLDIRKMGGEADILTADLSQPHQAEQLISDAFASGPVFGLVNNASIFEPQTFFDTDLDAWERHFAINLTAPFLLSQALARAVKPGAEARIINILDWRALRPGADHFPYTISKAALASLTRATAIALAPHILVNGLALGAILPPSDEADTSGIIDPVPAGRWAVLEEVGETLLFLLTGPAYITGEIIHLDGGRHLI